MVSVKLRPSMTQSFEGYTLLRYSPLVVSLHQDERDESQRCLSIRKRADNLDASANLFVQTLEHV